VTTHSESSCDWRRMAAELALDGRALVAGVRRADPGARRLMISAPRDGGDLTELEETRRGTVEAAVTAARLMFEGGSWSRAHPRDRAAILTAWAKAVERHRDELALLVCLEVGKPIRDAHRVDLASVARAIGWYGAVADKLSGAHPDVGADALALVSREPVGVAAVVLPWNFPLSGIGYDVAAALSLGNSVLVKPSERAPLAVLRCCELAYEAGVPPDALSVLPGGHATGELIGRNPEVDAVAVTGSPRAGRAFLAYSGQSNGKRVSLELGGKTAAIVTADAPDVEAAAETLVWGAFFNQGAMCTAPARLLVHRSVVERFVDALTRRMQALVVGDPLDWDTEIGALNSPDQARHVESAIREAVERGGRCVSGGTPVDVVAGGNYLSPTLIVDAPTSCDVFASEVWGPIASVHVFDSVAEAMELAAAPGFGIGMSVWTGSLCDAFRVARGAKVGTVWVNCFEGDDMTVPAGGVKRSGYGRTKALAALDKYSDLKSTWVNLKAART
jgi:4-(gamma-glutamylamino)butanal dehydrogenase